MSYSFGNQRADVSYVSSVSMSRTPAILTIGYKSGVSMRENTYARWKPAPYFGGTRKRSKGGFVPT
ncbi:MAG: hypothetical protein V1731_02955, partial [Candidatus Aenigmatarchaeota archaeon]